jgi:hypothetical protein
MEFGVAANNKTVLLIPLLLWGAMLMASGLPFFNQRFFQ